VAAVTAGVLFTSDLHLPFYTFAVVMVVALVVGLAIGRGVLHLPATEADFGAPTPS
jgi:hypothetical protein